MGCGQLLAISVEHPSQDCERVPGLRENGLAIAFSGDPVVAGQL